MLIHKLQQKVWHSCTVIFYMCVSTKYVDDIGYSHIIIVIEIRRFLTFCFNSKNIYHEKFKHSAIT